MKHYTKWKKVVTEVYILYDFIYMKVQNRKSHRNRNQINECLGPDVGTGDKQVMAKRYGVSFWEENALKLIVLIVIFICKYTKDHWIVHFKWMDCICELYFKKAI